MDNPAFYQSAIEVLVVLSVALLFQSSFSTRPKNNKDHLALALFPGIWAGGLVAAFSALASDSPKSSEYYATIAALCIISGVFINQTINAIQGKKVGQGESLVYVVFLLGLLAIVLFIR